MRSGLRSRERKIPTSFAGLVRMMPPMAIQDDAHHANVVEIVDRLMQIPSLSKGRADYLETWVELIEAYEARQASEATKISGARMLRHVMDQAGLSGSGLARLLGVHPTLGSKIVKGERRLTWDHAKKLGDYFKVSPVLFMD